MKHENLEVNPHAVAYLQEVIKFIEEHNIDEAQFEYNHSKLTLVKEDNTYTILPRRKSKSGERERSTVWLDSMNITRLREARDFLCLNNKEDPSFDGPSK